MLHHFFTKTIHNQAYRLFFANASLLAIEQLLIADF